MAVYRFEFPNPPPPKAAKDSFCFSRPEIPYLRLPAADVRSHPAAGLIRALGFCLNVLSSPGPTMTWIAFVPVFETNVTFFKSFSSREVDIFRVIFSPTFSFYTYVFFFARPNNCLYNRKIPTTARKFSSWVFLRDSPRRACPTLSLPFSFSLYIIPYKLFPPFCGESNFLLTGMNTFSSFRGASSEKLYRPPSLFRWE